ncbi:SLC13 family permease [Aquimonas sp.]|uniref:SLC13 family permease n=1 Tax=Aquimonas sp. TaxID=1872588 RepID=UPI0037C0FCAD
MDRSAAQRKPFEVRGKVNQLALRTAICALCTLTAHGSLALQRVRRSKPRGRNVRRPFSITESPGRREKQAPYRSLAVCRGQAVGGARPRRTQGAILRCIDLALFRCPAHDEAYKAVDGRVIMLLAGVLPMWNALQTPGAFGFLVDRMLDAIGGWGPLAVVVTMFLLTATPTALVNNNASAELLTPIAAAAAQSIDAKPAAFLVAVAFAASTGFATPVGYRTHTMVGSASGYQFMAFAKSQRAAQPAVPGICGGACSDHLAPVRAEFTCNSSVGHQSAGRPCYHHPLLEPRGTPCVAR